MTKRRKTKKNKFSKIRKSLEDKLKFKGDHKFACFDCETFVNSSTDDKSAIFGMSTMVLGSGNDNLRFLPLIGLDKTMPLIGNLEHIDRRTNQDNLNIDEIFAKYKSLKESGSKPHFIDTLGGLSDEEILKPVERKNYRVNIVDIEKLEEKLDQNSLAGYRRYLNKGELPKELINYNIGFILNVDHALMSEKSDFVGCREVHKELPYVKKNKKVEFEKCDDPRVLRIKGKRFLREDEIPENPNDLRTTYVIKADYSSPENQKLKIKVRNKIMWRTLEEFLHFLYTDYYCGTDTLSISLCTTVIENLGETKQHVREEFKKYLHEKSKEEFENISSPTIQSYFCPSDLSYDEWFTSEENQKNIESYLDNIVGN